LKYLNAICKFFVSSGAPLYPGKYEFDVYVNIISKLPMAPT